MPQAEDYQIADAVAATITGASLSITPASVSRLYVPKFATKDMTTGDVLVYVLPRGIRVERATKGGLWDYTITTHVGVVKPRQATTNAVIDPLRDYSEEIFRLLRDTKYSTGDTPDDIEAWFRSRTNVDVTYDPEQLDENQLYVSLQAIEWGAYI